MPLLITFIPDPILFQLGPLTVYWYGLFIVFGMLAGTLVITRLGKKSGLDQDTLLDAMFWTILFGIIGARLYHVFLELSFYLARPLQILEIWKGGLAIHGGLIAGGLALFIFTKKKKLDFWLITSIFAPAIALAQAIGRWGNFFNQELYGAPTDLPWAIPIDSGHRLPGFTSFSHFHPTFLYESIGNLTIFIILILLHKKNQKNPTAYSYFLFPISYLILYSLLRFSTEFIRIDPTPVFLSLRLPQIASLLIVIVILSILFAKKSKKSTKKPADSPPIYKN